MSKGIANAFRVPGTKGKDSPYGTDSSSVPFWCVSSCARCSIPADAFCFIRMGLSKNGAMAVLNLFSGGALSRMSVFSLGIMPYITAQIIFQMMQSVIPSLGELAKDGESGQRKITQYTRYLTVGLALLNAVGYLFLFKSYGVSFASMEGVPEALETSW